MARGALWLFAALVAPGALASSGVVIDPRGEPIEDVRVCYIAGDAEQLCVSTDEAGAWALPSSAIDTVRLSRDGFVPITIDGSDQPEPVILHPAARLHVRLVGPDGKPVTTGEVDVLLPSGKRYGPFPIQNAAGTKIASLEPGPVVIVGRSEGYSETRAAESELPAGEETLAVIHLQPVTRKSR